jgi:hypothetical protein
MRVGDSANVSEGFVEDEMSWKIRGRPEFPLNHVAREIGHNQIFRTHLVIGDTTRLNRDQIFRPINPAHIPKCMQNQPSTNQFEVRVQYGVAQFL